MAEALGIAGSIVGIAGFTLQLVQGVAALKAFCDSVKNVPSELRECVVSWNTRRNCSNA
jgi:hypothetical protein